MYKLVVLLILLPIFSYAQIDYSLCTDFIDQTNGNIAKSGFAFPFVMDKATGKIKTTNTQVNSRQEGSNQVYNVGDQRTKMEVWAMKDEAGVLQGIKINSEGKYNNGVPFKNSTSVNMKIKNGKCFAQDSIKTMESNGKSMAITLFDTTLCKSIQDHIEKNKDLKKCFDDQSKENQEMKKIFADSGFDQENIKKNYLPFTPILDRTSYSVEQKVLLGTSDAYDIAKLENPSQNQIMMSMVGGSPVISGYMILNDCYEKGLASTLNDQALWKEATPTKEKENEAKQD